LKVQDPTTGTYASATLKWSYSALSPDGSTQTVQVFDLAGKVHGEPHANGEGGPAVVRTKEA